MRKTDPTGVRTEWSSDLSALLDYFDRTRNALTGSHNEKADISRLAELTFLSAFVAFEGFCSDIFIAYLNHDFSYYQGDLENRIRTSTTDRFGPWAESRVHFKTLTHIPMNQLADAVDPDYRNLTFGTAEKMVDKANVWLAPTHRKRIASLNAHDKRLYDTAKSIRNYIAHKSNSAKKLMNERLASIDRGSPNTGLGRGDNWVHNIGSFLKSWCDGMARVEKYIVRMESLVRKM